MNAEAKDKLILLVDDDEDFLLQTRMALEAAGYKVAPRSSMKDAEQFIVEKRPDMVIADLMMEHMDAGFVLCQHIKKRDATIPVILVTAVTSETGMEFEAGGPRSWIKADAILAKPVRAEQLKREINRLLEA
jgi:CheY-like chemotaxis protein